MMFKKYKPMAAWFLLNFVIGALPSLISVILVEAHVKTVVYPVLTVCVVALATNIYVAITKSEADALDRRNLFSYAVTFLLGLILFSTYLPKAIDNLSGFGLKTLWFTALFIILTYLSVLISIKLYKYSDEFKAFQAKITEEAKIRKQDIEGQQLTEFDNGDL